MLETFRKHSGSLFVKILLGAIIASFALWGVADMIRSWNDLKPIARVGKQDITYPQYRHALQDEINKLQTLTKMHLTPEQLKLFNVYQNVLDRLVTQSLLKEEVRKLNLDVSDDLIKGEIFTMPAFQENGRFSEEKLAIILRNNNLSQPQFVSKVKESMLLAPLFSTVTQQLDLDDVYVETLFKALTQIKYFDGFTINPAKLSVKKVSDEDLKKFYQDSKDQFKTKERRSFALLTINHKKIKDEITVTEADLKAEYDARINDFTRPEKRRIQKITVPTKILAEQAEADLKAGKTMEAVSKTVEGAELTTLGLLEENALTADIAAPLFSLNKGGVSTVIKEESGFYSLYKVLSIQAPVTKKFEDVKKTLEKDLKERRMGPFLESLKARVEDALAGRDDKVSVMDIAKENNLDVSSFDGLDGNGITKKGKSGLSAYNGDDQRQVLGKVFELNLYEESEIIDLNDETSAIVYVTKIEEAKIPELKDIKADVTKALTLKLKGEKAVKIAEEATKLKTLKDFEAFAKKHKAVLKKGYQASRSDEKNEFVASLDHQLQQTLFTATKNQVLYGLKGREVIVLMNTKASIPAKDAKKFKSFKRNMEQGFKQDLEELYVNSLRSHHAVKINDSMMNYAIGQGN